MPDPIDTDDLPDTERLRLNRDGYLEPWPDGMLCYYAHFKTVVSDLRADLSALRAREAEMLALLTPFVDAMAIAMKALPRGSLGEIEALAKHHLPGGTLHRLRAALSQPDSGEGADHG